MNTRTQASTNPMTTAQARTLAYDAYRLGAYVEAARYYDTALKLYPRSGSGSQLEALDIRSLTKYRDDARRAAAVLVTL